MTSQQRKIRCSKCNKLLGVQKKDLVEIKCPRCGAIHTWNQKTQILSRVRKGVRRDDRTKSKPRKPR